MARLAASKLAVVLIFLFEFARSEEKKCLPDVGTSGSEEIIPLLVESWERKTSNSYVSLWLTLSLVKNLKES